MVDATAELQVRALRKHAASKPASHDVPIFRHLTLIELQHGDCKWPEGDSNYTFCGAPQEFGSPYCAWHRKRASNG